jgi:CBS domain-containing protein
MAVERDTRTQQGIDSVDPKPTRVPTPWRLAGASTGQASVRMVMNQKFLSVHEDELVATIAKLLVTEKLFAAIVVGREGYPVGIIGTVELARALYWGDASGEVARAGDVMRPMHFELPEDATVSQVAALMAYEGLREIPIVSVERKVVGIVTALDVARWLALREGYLVPEGDPGTVS